jgi:hypothetical protein
MINLEKNMERSGRALLQGSNLAAGSEEIHEKKHLH